MTAGSDARSTPSDLPLLLRRRLLVVAVLIALASGFFASYRAVQPVEFAYFTASP